MVLQDVLEGIHSLEVAREMYKVAIDPKEWKVSTKNTKKLREEARKERLKKGKKEVAESPKGKTGKEKKSI